MNRIGRCPPGPCSGRRRCARLADHLHRSRQPQPGAPTRQGADPMRNDPPVTDLVTRARDGDQQARDVLIERYKPGSPSTSSSSPSPTQRGMRHSSTRPKLPAANSHVHRRPPPCTQISASLNILVGSIGPHRRGCLDKLRRHLATAALINTEAHSTRSDINGQPKVQ
jgi:hypothetical protein